jgi:SAM-dependent methyltransferase
MSSLAQQTGGPISLYERMGERATQPFALDVLDLLGPIEGLSLIDAAAGTGGLAVVAAERGAEVLATDISPAMIDRVRERLRPFSSCRSEVMDFRGLTVADDTFDIATSIFGVLAFSSFQRGLEEMARVTRPGGQIALAMWTHRGDCSPAHLLRRVFSELFPYRELWPSDMFPVFSEEALAAHLRGTGCSNIHVHVATAEWSPFSSAEVVSECDPMFKGFPGYAALTAEEAASLHTSLADGFQGYAGSDGIIRLPTKAFVVTARKL